MSFAQFPAGTMAILPGAPNPEFTSDPYNVSDFAIPPDDASASIQLNQTSNRVRQLRTDSPDGDIGFWGDGTLIITDWDFRLDTSIGNLDIGQAADVWIVGFNGMFWGVQETGMSTEIFTGTLRVRPTGGGADIDTAPVSLTAEATP
jgi:hypothetical protein